jgi:enamine deaminase RidA (YjgF/YER057c/UK114 family)
VQVAFARLGHGLASVGASWEDIVNLTTFLVGADSVEEYIVARAEVYRDVYGEGPYPPHTLAVVDGLADPAWLIEMNAIAALL